MEALLLTRRTIGVVTDTHVGDELTALPPEVGARLADADLILHAGDAVDPGVVTELGRLAPVVTVMGNHDPIDWRVPRQTVVELDGLRIGLTHGIRPAAVEHVSALWLLATGRLDIEGHCRALVRRFPAVDCIVFGHLHIPIRHRVGGTLCFSPGSVYQPEQDPRFDWTSRSRRIYRAVRGRLPDSYRRAAIGLLHDGPGGLRAEAVPLTRSLR